MSEPKRWELWEVIMEDTNSEWVRFEDYARLKAEVERLKSLCDNLGMGGKHTVTAIVEENARLKAEVERLRKAGDAMAETLEGAGFDSAMDFWNAAKEGKPSV